MTNQNNNAPVASKNRPFSQDYYSVSDFFTPQTDASPNSSYDNAYALVTQAHATVVALTSDGSDLKDGFSLSQEIICNLLWSIQTQLEMAQAALQHMAKADTASQTGGVQ